MRRKTTFGRFSLVLVHVFFGAAALAQSPVHVLIWDEQQPRQSEAYSDFLGNEIAARLKDDQFEIRSAALSDPDQGLSSGNLEWADVIVWWGHVRHSDVPQEKALQILQYVREGELDLVVLHSAHWARPFVEAMNWRSVHDARQHLQKIAGERKVELETVAPPRERTVPTHGSVHTPAVFGYKKNQKIYQGIVHLPWCCFPDYRPDGAPSTIHVKQPAHPLAEGLPTTFQIKATEMYNEPFHVPEPDAVVFEETWERGEHFRSGMVWEIGKGKVFYFRPGHEQYPVFKQPEMIQVIKNACRWLGTN
ncbi:MAG: ThuA domain-containing protein [Planctomycetota bacterium]